MVNRSQSFFSDRGPENTNLVEGVVYLLPVTFGQIRLSGFREDETGSTKARKTNIVEDVEILLSVKFC